MNETPDALYRRALRRDSSRSNIWVGAAILTLIAATSLYIGRAGEKNEPAGGRHQQCGSKFHKHFRENN